MQENYTDEEQKLLAVAGKCPIHSSTMENYCETCSRLLCDDCYLEHASQHPSHEQYSCKEKAIKSAALYNSSITLSTTEQQTNKELAKLVAHLNKMAGEFNAAITSVISLHEAQLQVLTQKTTIKAQFAAQIKVLIKEKQYVKACLLGNKLRVEPKEDCKTPAIQVPALRAAFDSLKEQFTVNLNAAYTLLTALGGESRPPESPPAASEPDVRMSTD